MDQTRDFNSKLSNTFGIQIPRLFFIVLADLLIARILGPEDKGAYSIFRSNGGFLLLLLNLGFHSAVVYFISNKQYRASDLLGWAYQLLFVVFLLSGIFTIFFYSNNVEGIFFPEPYSEGLFLLFYPLITLFSVAELFFRAFLIAYKKIEAANYIELGINLFRAILVLILFFISFETAWGLPIILGIQLALFLIGMIIYQGYIFIFLKVRPHFKWIGGGAFKQIFRYSFFLYAAAILQFFNYKLDYWFIQYFDTTYTLGLYSVATELTQLVWVSSQSISLVLFPFLASYQKRSEQIAQLQPLFKVNLWLSLLFILLCLMIPELLIQLAFGKAYLEAAPILLILAIGTAALNCARLLAVFSSAVGDTQYNLLAVSISLVVTLILNFLLIPPYKLWGAAISTCAAYLSFLATFVIIGSRKYRINWSTFIIPSKQDLRYWKSFLNRDH